MCVFYTWTFIIFILPYILTLLCLQSAFFWYLYLRTFVSSPCNLPYRLWYNFISLGNFVKIPLCTRCFTGWDGLVTQLCHILCHIRVSCHPPFWFHTHIYGNSICGAIPLEIILWILRSYIRHLWHYVTCIFVSCPQQPHFCRMVVCKTFLLFSKILLTWEIDTLHLFMMPTGMASISDCSVCSYVLEAGNSFICYNISARPALFT